jgi:hypothetical protein
MSHIYATKNYAIAHFYFRWTEPDCETLLVDPQGEVYIISKVKNAAAKAALMFFFLEIWSLVSSENFHFSTCAQSC